MCVHEGQKDSNVIFKESHSQANLVFLLRFLSFIAFPFSPCSIIFKWKMKFIKGLYCLDEIDLLLTPLALTRDGFILIKIY